MKLEETQKIADDLRFQLRSYCTRIEIAGSVRRQKPEVKDIELVAVPKVTEAKDLFGNVISLISSLDTIDWREYGGVVKNGMRYKQINLKAGINLDLFIVLPPAQWGVIYTIRTGPPEFSQWLVTTKSKGGALPDQYRVLDGAIRARLNLDMIFSTAEEADFFELLGLKWLDPWERQAIWRGR